MKIGLWVLKFYEIFILKMRVGNGDRISVLTAKHQKIFLNRNIQNVSEIG